MLQINCKQEIVHIEQNIYIELLKGWGYISQTIGKFEPPGAQLSNQSCGSGYSFWKSKKIGSESDFFEEEKNRIWICFFLSLSNVKIKIERKKV